MQLSKVLLGFVCCALVVVLVQATSDSDPKYIYLCDAHSDNWGCNPTQWTSGNRLRCRNTTRIMNWASWPVRSACYKVVAGDEGAPATKYTPDEFIDIHVRVKCYDMNYRGLMIYAENTNGTRVGEWELPFDEPALFTLPWKELTESPCYGTLMHASGVHKPYHVALHFKAPPAGTGPITFKSLIKQGDANTGAFYWPEEDITLQEGARSPSRDIQWVQSDLSQSCSSACEAIDLGCDESAFLGLNSPDAFQNALGGQFACKLPLLSGCGDRGASMDGTDNYCYFVEGNCAAQNRTRSSVTCDTVVVNSQRFCPCSDDVRSDASLPRMAPLLLLLPAFLLNHRAAAFLAALLLVSSMTTSVSAHNWIKSASRSLSASTITPCKSPLTDVPHAQVGPNQEFSVEWMTGHGFPTYFAVVHSRDADKLRLNTVTVLEDYINSAPEGVVDQGQDLRWQKYHRKNTNNTDNDYSPDVNQTNFFERLVPETDPLYIPRPLKANTTNGVMYQMKYKPDHIATDRRVSYRSAKYPWLEAVSKFLIVTSAPNRFDTARFVIPGFGGEGRYIVHYYWRGYRDCIDVDYKPAPTQYVYGYPVGEPVWARIDHCLFQKVTNVYDVSEIVTDPQYCLDRCVARGGGCYGVNVVPLSAPPSAYQGFLPKSTEVWKHPEIYGSDIYIPWNHTFFLSRPELSTAFTRNASHHNFICYTVQPRPGTDTEDEYSLASDPEDPLFYSTCFFRLATIAMFDDYAVNTPSSNDKLSVPWRFHDRCIDCKLRSFNSYMDSLPTWNVADVCVNCDLESIQVPPPTYAQPLLVESGVKCDGADSTTWYRNGIHHTCDNATALTCSKRMIPVGRTNNSAVSLEECRALVSRDAECSGVFTYTNRTSTSRCWCYTNQPCCKQCSRVPINGGYAVYQLESTPDPTCASGVLSEDGASCCSASCGAGNCTATTTAKDQVGFCSSVIPDSRPCTLFGPPCKVVVA